MSHLDELFKGLPPQLNIEQLAELLGMTRKGVYRWVQNGVIPAYKLGGTWLILRDEVKDVLRQGSNLTSEEPDDTVS